MVLEISVLEIVFETKFETKFETLRDFSNLPIEMSYLYNRKRQLTGYRRRQSESFERLKMHIKVSSFADVVEIRNIASRFGEDGMTLPRISGYIQRAEQTQVITETFLEALKTEQRYLEVESRVCIRLLLVKNNRLLTGRASD